MPDTLTPDDNRHNAVEMKAEIERLTQRLHEVEETLSAIRNGEVDAVLVQDSSGEQATVLTLTSADSSFSLMIEEAAYPSALLSFDGEILQCNQAFQTLLHFDAPLNGRTLSSLVDAASETSAQNLVQSGRVRVTEKTLILRNGDGLRVPSSLRIRPITTGLAGPRLLLTDHTEERLKDKILSEEILAQSVLEQVADAVFVCDSEGRIVRASRAMEKLVRSNPVGRAFDETLSLETTDTQVALTFASLSDLPDHPSLEVKMTHRDGQSAFLLMSVGFLFDKLGQRREAVVTLTDISERKHAESELAEADRRKDEFLAILAHELRNPLAPIANSVTLLSSGFMPPKMQQQAVEMMDRQVRHMVRLVDDLMDVSRISRGKIELKSEPLDLRDVLQSAVEAATPLIGQMQHRLHVDLPDAALNVTGDFTRLSQTFANLLNNAAKYSAPQGDIHLSALARDGQAEITVKDSGIGIAPHMLERIFDLFAQVDSSFERLHGGLGVGLNLVRTLVRMHGGEVSAESEGPGQGSAFTVRLPLAMHALRRFMTRPMSPPAATRLYYVS